MLFAEKYRKVGDEKVAVCEMLRMNRSSACVRESGRDSSLPAGSVNIKCAWLVFGFRVLWDGSPGLPWPALHPHAPLFSPGV